MTSKFSKVILLSTCAGEGKNPQTELPAGSDTGKPLSALVAVVADGFDRTTFFRFLALRLFFG